MPYFKHPKPVSSKRSFGFENSNTRLRPLPARKIFWFILSKRRFRWKTAWRLLSGSKRNRLQSNLLGKMKTAIFVSQEKYIKPRSSRVSWSGVSHFLFFFFQFRKYRIFNDFMCFFIQIDFQRVKLDPLWVCLAFFSYSTYMSKRVKGQSLRFWS